MGVFCNICPHTNMKYMLFALVFLAGLAAAIMEEEEDEMMLSKGFFEIVSEIHDKLRQLRHEVACGKTVRELIELLGLPDTLETVVIVARGWLCDNVWDY